MSKQSPYPRLGKEPNRKSWYIYWYDPVKKRVSRFSTKTKNKTEAECALNAFILRRTKGGQKIGPMSPDEYPVETALRWYLHEWGSEIATTPLVVRTVNRFMKFFGPSAMVSDLTPQTLKRYVQEHKRLPRTHQTKEGIWLIEDKRPTTKATIRRELVILIAALNHALANRRLTSSPKIPLPPIGEHERRYLEPEEISRLLNNCPEPHVCLFIKLGIITGARKGALLELTWNQVDFANKLIYLNPPDREQTKKHRAIVPINEHLYQDLIRTKMEQEKCATEHVKKGGGKLEPCRHVIAYKLRPVKDIRKGFHRSCTRAGIEGATPHTLRHTAGTLMALAGIDLFLIARLLGHSVQRTTELYAHLRPDYLRDAVDVLATAAYSGQLMRVNYREQATIKHQKGDDPLVL